MKRRPGSILAIALSLALPACGSAGGAAGDGAGGLEAPVLLVVNKSASTLSALDPGTGEEVAVVATGFSPHEVAATPDGSLAVVTDYGSGPRPGNTLTVVDVGSFEVVRTVDLSPHTRPHGIWAVSDGTVWVTTEGSRHVLHVDPRTGEILHAVETGQEVTHQVAVSEAMDRVITANIGSGTATVVDASTGEVMAHVRTGAGAEGIDVHPDGRRVYVTNREAGTLSEIDLETNALRRSLQVGEVPIRVRVTPDGGRALVSNAGGDEVAVVGLGAWEVERRLPVGSVPVGILVTPDGGTAYVANTADDRLAVIDLGAWEVAGSVATGDEPDGMAWVRERW